MRPLRASSPLIPADRFSFLSRIATLAGAANPFRVGSPSPGAEPSLAGAPPANADEARPSSGSALRRSLRACTAEGMFAEIVTACSGGAVLTAWALYLNAGPLLTGVLVALSQMAQLCQIPAAWTTAILGHRRACLLLVGASRQVLLPLAALPFLPVEEGTRQTILVAFAALSAILGVLGNNAWVAWMGELVPRRIRGRYFGRRSGLNMFGGALAAAAAGVLLDWSRARGLEAYALVALQLVAYASGRVTITLMKRQHDPCTALPPRSLHPVQALLPFRDRAVRPFIAYQLAWNFAVGMAGSFFALHMLRNLKMGFTLVALHGAALAASRMLAAPMWGRLIDRFGARPVLLTCSFGISANLLMWLIPTEQRLWPIAIDALLAGIFWSGQSLAVFSLPLTLTPREGRPFYLAGFSAAGGLAFSVATILGGALAARWPDTFVVAGHTFHDLQVLFVVSAVLRMGAAFLTIAIVEPSSRRVGELWAQLAATAARLPPARPDVRAFSRRPPRVTPPPGERPAV